MCEDFAPNFGYKRTGCYVTKTQHLSLPFSPGNVLTKTLTQHDFEDEFKMLEALGRLHTLEMELLRG
jgi:hypothetical protein